MIKNKEGFTLIELLIVMALMTLLWGVAYAMFYQSKKVFSISGKRMGMYQYARITLDSISKDLKGATLKDKTDFFKSFTTSQVSGLTPPPKDTGSILTLLSFTTNGSSTPATLITYYLTNTDEIMRAEYNDTSYIYGTVSNFNPGSSTFYKLSRNTNYFSLTYVTGSSSVSSWDSTNGTTTGLLPDAIKVTLQIYGTGTGDLLETGTFTTEVTLPSQIAQ